MLKSIYKMSLATIIILLLCTLTLTAQTKAKTKSACRIYADTENSVSVLGYVPIGKEVEVLEVVSDYLLIQYEEYKGYILKDKTNMSQVVDNEAIAPLTQNVDLPTDRFSILAQKYGYTTAIAIYEHKIWKGIDHNTVKDSWGKPLKVSMEIGTSSTIEKWIYRKSWLKFKDGILYEWGPNTR